jgi:membrane fusion protein (multidrug efflux system)
LRLVRWRAAGAGLLGALALGACSNGSAAKARTRPPPLVSVAPVAVRDVPVEVRAPIDLRPLAQADVGSKTLGYLDAVLVERGDKVKKGQIVALVRPSDLPDQLAVARGALAQTQSSAALARTNYDRARALAPQAVVSQQELQQAETQLATAEAAQQAARSQISALAVRLGETKIQSPLTGVVSQRRLDPGTLVGPPGGGAIVTVARVDVLRVFITINERDLAGVTVGKDAHLALDALPGRLFTGKVVRLAPGLDPVTRTLDAEVQLPNDLGELRPGMYGRGAIIVDVHPRALVVTVGAVVISDEKAHVFVLAGDKVQRRSVELGVDGGDWLEIKSGLRPGEEVVVAGADGLADGSKVRVSRGVDPYSGARSGSPPAPAERAAAPSNPGSARN